MPRDHGTRRWPRRSVFESALDDLLPVSPPALLNLCQYSFRTVLPLLPIFVVLFAVCAWYPAFAVSYHWWIASRKAHKAAAAAPANQADAQTGQAGAEISHRAAISTLFAETIHDSGKRTSKGSIIFSEVSPNSPPVCFSRMSERTPTIHWPHDAPPLPPTRRSSWTSEHTRVGADEKEDLDGPQLSADGQDERGESWGTFGVGQAV